MLFVSAGQPVIESSKNIRFGPFHYSYFSLRGQFEAAKLNPWNSEWSNVHDFHSAEGKHWDYLPHNTRCHDLLKPLSESGSLTEQTDDFIVPFTHGDRHRSKLQLAAVIIFHPYHQLAYDVIEQLQPKTNGGDLLLIRTRIVKMPKDRVQSMFNKKADHLTKIASDGPMIGMEFEGAESIEAIRQVLSAIGHNDSKIYLSQDAATAKQVIDVFFATQPLF